MDMTTIESKICKKCPNEVWPEAFLWNNALCDACYTMACQMETKENKTKGELQKRLEDWKFKCPEAYRDNPTDMIDATNFKQIVSWKFNPKGLLCMGDSRKGKTTCCWKLLEKLWINDGTNFQAMSEPEFAQLAAKNSRNRILDSWLDMLCSCKLLFLDDIGHAATTGKHLEELYYVVEKRTSWKKPIISTTQYTSEELISRSKHNGGEKTAIAIINRLKAASDVVIFS